MKRIKNIGLVSVTFTLFLTGCAGQIEADEKNKLCLLLRKRAKT